MCVRLLCICVRTASSLLRESAKRGHAEVIALLLSRGANVNAASVRGACKCRIYLVTAVITQHAMTDCTIHP
jgi:hypothetical protein